MENLREVLNAETAAVDMDEPDYTQQEVGEKRDVSGGNGGVIKELIKPGSSWEMPEKGDKVTVHYTGTLESDGSEFDSSRGRGDPFTFTLGQGQVIKGWDVGVATMKKGEVCKLFIRSDYGYGDSGSPPKIPGGATLVFEVELIEWKSVKDISGDGGVIKTIVKEGEGWATPRDADEALVKIAARVEGAEQPFYESPEAGEQFYVKDGLFCKGIATAVKTMKKGEVVKLVVKPEYAFGAEGRGSEVPSNATLEVALTLVSWNKVEDVTQDGGVVKKTVLETSEWQRPNAGASVTIEYIARLDDGTVFDQHVGDDALTFVCDEEQAPCEGLELAVMQMKKGEKALVTIQPQYAFKESGGNGNKGAVPANATVCYEVTLKDMVKAKETWNMDVNEKLEAATVAKESGNAAFKAGKINRALKLWERAKQAIEHDDGYEPEKKRAARALKQSLDLNIAAALLKAGRPAEARKNLSKVLEHDSNNLKALYRRAQSYIDTGDWVEAAQDIKLGLQVEPTNTDFKLLARKLKAAEAAAAKTEKQLWARGFAKMAKSSAADTATESNGAKEGQENGVAAAEEAAAVEA